MNMHEPVFTVKDLREALLNVPDNAVVIVFSGTCDAPEPWTGTIEKYDDATDFRNWDIPTGVPCIFLPGQ